MNAVTTSTNELLNRPPRVLRLHVAAITLSALAAWLLPRFTNGTASVVSIVQSSLIIVSLGLAAVAVALRPRWFPGLMLAGLTFGQAAIALPPTWDTIRMALVVFSIGAAIAAGIVVLPRPMQRFAISLAIMFHFGGILVAVTSVPPPFAAPSWLATHLWNRVYRPYFQFMYLFNAYHFYSPDPGPATLVCACVTYSDNTHQWVHFPNRQEHMKDPLAVGYYRRLAITEASNQSLPVTPVSPLAVESRTLAGLLIGIPAPDRIAEVYSGVAQYRPPTNYTRELLQSFARRIAIQYPHSDPRVAIAGIKIYRVTHGLLTPKQLHEGKKPTDADLYIPFYQGEFAADGRLKDPGDPFLYWFIPYIKFAREPIRPTDRTGDSAESDARSNSYLELHATSPSWRGQ